MADVLCCLVEYAMVRHKHLILMEIIRKMGLVQELLVIILQDCRQQLPTMLVHTLQIETEHIMLLILSVLLRKVVCLK